MRDYNAGGGIMRTALRLPEPTPEALAELATLYRRTRNVHLRRRAPIILLALEQHLIAAAIARIVRSDAETVRRWLKRSQAEGIAGLADLPGGGAPAKVTEAYQTLLVQTVRQRPRSLGQPYSLWTLQRLADYLAEQTGIRVSDETVRRALAAGEIVLSRPQHTISSPDPEYQLKKRRSKRLATT